jgi:hypothetical protein
MRFRYALAAALAAVAALVGIGVTAASATSETSAAVSVKFCHSGWYVNPDEGGSDPKQGDRLPTPVAGGLHFQGNDLVHHETNIPVASLKPGTYVASPAPSLSSFFSVEVLNSNGTGYATLRWDVEKGQWNIGGTSFYDADPAKLVADHGKGTTVRSFGVGYVNSPNNGVETVVSSVTFAGKTYLFTCTPKPSQTATPTTSKPSTSVPTTITSTSTRPGTVTTTVINPAQFATVPNTSKGVDTGDGSLS